MLSRSFLAAVAKSRALRAKWPLAFSPAVKAELFALYKQSTLGDYFHRINTTTSKHDDDNHIQWALLRGKLSPDQAQVAYTSSVHRIEANIINKTG